MKKILKKILFSLSVVILLTSCEINDPVDDITRIGQVAPHVFWELPSNSVNAGSSVAFYAQYYTTGNADIDRLEVWYDVNENIQTMVSCPLVTTFKYNISTNNTTQIREFQKIETYAHNVNNWDSLKRAYILDTTFTTSRTLRTVEWKEVKTFEDSKFNAYFPANFATQFKDSLYPLLKVADFRKIMVSLNVTSDIEFKAFTDSTFNANSGTYDYFIKPEKKAELRTKYDGIAFKDLIYDQSAQIYKVEYTRVYKLNARFKAFDKNQIVGIADKKEIDLR
ncbi:MAG: hypothetical protein VB066_06990 [Paludibacter sp.]|nr:hypothetical protein [Paludibacter sp.]